MSATTTGEVMRVVLPPDLKTQFQEKCEAFGQKMSERARQLILADVMEEATPAARLTAILQSAKVKNERSGLGTPSIEDIDRFIEKVREERIEQGLV